MCFVPKIQFSLWSRATDRITKHFYFIILLCHFVAVFLCVYALLLLYLINHYQPIYFANLKKHLSFYLLLLLLSYMERCCTQFFCCNFEVPHKKNALPVVGNNRVFSANTLFATFRYVPTKTQCVFTD